MSTPTTSTVALPDPRIVILDAVIKGELTLEEGAARIRQLKREKRAAGGGAP